MKSFTELLSEEITHTIHKSTDGKTVYSHDINGHNVSVQFTPNKKNKKDYDVKFIKKTKGKPQEHFSKNSIDNMEVEDRLKSIHHLKKSVKHFIDTEKPNNLVSSHPDKSNVDWSHDLFGRASRGTGLVNRHDKASVFTIKK